MKFAADSRPELISKYLEMCRYSEFSAITGLLLISCYLFLFWSLRLSSMLVAMLLQHVRVIKLCKSHPYISLSFGYLVLALAAYGADHAVDQYALPLFLLLGWFSFGVINVSVSKIRGSRPVPIFGTLDSWFAVRLKNRTDIAAVRVIVANTFMLAPAFGLFLFPATCSLLTFAAYLSIFFQISVRQEYVIHYDVHNHFFRYRHLKSSSDRLVFKLSNLYTKIAIPFLSCRVPFHYSVTHGIIHHSEDNGIEDVQSTLYYDRTSFLDFCRFVSCIASGLIIGVMNFRYLKRRNMRKPIWLLLKGYLIWYSALIVISLMNPIGSVILLCVPMLAAVITAAGVMFWHGLVDMSDVDNIYTNSINLDVDFRTGLGWHVEHHLRPNEHWGKQGRNALIDTRSYRKQGTIVLKPIENLNFVLLKAMWTRSFLGMANLCAPTCDRQRNIDFLAETIEQRCAPLVRVMRGPLYEALDKVLGKLVGGLFPGKMLRSSEPSFDMDKLVESY